METSVCKTCHETKDVGDFMRGYGTFFMCKSCAAAKQRVKVNCSICNKLISYGNLHKHMYVHNKCNPLKEKIECDCGKTICGYSYHTHLKSYTHIAAIAC